MYPINPPLTTPYFNSVECEILFSLITAVIGASVGSTAAVLLLAIIVVLIIIACMAVLKPKKKGKVFSSDFSIIGGQPQAYNYLLLQL